MFVNVWYGLILLLWNGLKTKHSFLKTVVGENFANKEKEHLEGEKCDGVQISAWLRLHEATKLMGRSVDFEIYSISLK